MSVQDFLDKYKYNLLSDLKESPHYIQSSYCSKCLITSKKECCDKCGDNLLIWIKTLENSNIFIEDSYF